MGNLHKNIQLMLEFLKGSSLALPVSYYTLMTFVMSLSVIFDIYPDDTTHCSKCHKASDLWQQLELVSKLEPDLQGCVDWGRKWLVDFNAVKLNQFRLDQSKNTGAIDLNMDGSPVEEKSSFKMLGLTVVSEWDWGCYIISVVKTASKRIGDMICSIKFLSPEFALYLYKSTICPCMECCCHVWTGAPSFYIEFLDKP